MNIWLVLWGSLATTLIGFSVWTFAILMSQKQGWKTYAEKRKLRYKSNALMESPTVEGAIGNHTINCFTSEHQAQDARLSRKLTAIEVKLNSVMPVSGAIASGEMVEIMKIMELKFEHVPDHKDWDKEYVASADNKGILAAYMTEERIQAICRLMKIKNSWVILVFKDQAMLLRIDLARPLASAKELDAMLKEMLAVTEVLELKKGEEKVLESEGEKIFSDGVVLELDVDDDDLEAAGALSLEPEEDAVAESEDEQASDKENAEDKKSSASSKS